MLMLDVWREVCKHLELREAIELIAPLLRQRVPLAGLIVRRVDLNRSVSEAAVAAWLTDPPGRTWQPARTPLSEGAAAYLFDWASHAPARRLSFPQDRTAFEILGLTRDAGDIVAAVLMEEGHPDSVVAMVAERGATFDDDAVQLLERLLEPMSAAVANDARIQEMTRMRAAVEADNRALLSRLARSDLSEAIIGAEAGLRDVMQKVSQVALTDAPVLIIGETGTGKEVVARTIHAQSARASGPVERVNCGAIAPGLVDSELFGHERGSFTGAVSTRRGWFERADGGTLFLDEVGELLPDAQVRLLRILQDGTFERVGGQRTLRVDVRIVAATHRNLGEMVRAGRFRQDLWYRLSVFPIHLPPLRERPQDIPALAAHFAYRVGKRLGGGPLLPSAADLEMLVSYPWPGNVRELAAVIERAAILGNGARLEIAASLGVIPPKLMDAEPSSGNGTAATRLQTLDEAMAEHIKRALAVTRGRIEGENGAAALLGINPHTLRARMRKLNVVWREYRVRT